MRRTRAQKAAIVGQAEVIGIRPAARAAGVPESSVRYWQESAEFAQLRARKKDEVTEEVWAAFQIGVRRIADLIPKTDDIGKVAVATGIVYDKFALMSGHATERTESRDITQTLSDHESEALRAAIEEVLVAAE